MLHESRSHLVLLQCPSWKEGMCNFCQKVINVPWYNWAKKRRGKPSWFHYALLISQSHYHKNASASTENQSIVSMTKLKTLIQTKRWLGDFPPYLVNVHSHAHKYKCSQEILQWINMLCGNKDEEVFIAMVILGMQCEICSQKPMANWMNFWVLITLWGPW